MRGLTRLGIVVEAISKFLREPRRLRPALHSRVDPEAVRKYLDREGDGCFARTKPSESKRRLPEAAADLLVLVTQFRDPAAAELESHRIPARVLAEQREVVADPEVGPRVRVKEPDEMTCDVVLNPAEPDATYNKHRGVGYLVQIMETYSPDPADHAGAEASPPAKPDPITHVSAGPMNVHDGAALEPALADTEARGIKRREVLGDSHYGSEEDVKEAATHGVEVVAPAMPAKGSKQGKLTLEDFALDARGHVTRCPGGQPPLSTSEGEGRIQAVFDEAACAACPLRGVPGRGGGPRGATLPVHAGPGPPSRAAVGGQDGGVPRSLSVAIGDRGDDVAAEVPDAAGVVAGPRSGVGGLSDVLAGVGPGYPPSGGLAGGPVRPNRGLSRPLRGPGGTQRPLRTPGRRSGPIPLPGHRGGRNERVISGGRSLAGFLPARRSVDNHLVIKGQSG